MKVEKMSKKDWPQVAHIYEQGIRSKNATFEQECPEWKVWNEKHREDCRLIATEKGKITGWAALSNVSGRQVYSGVCEVSIYVEESSYRKGIGDFLMKKLIEESEKSGIWTLQAGIFPENKASISLHEKNGFRVVGTRERLGKMDDIWRDIVLMERRSKKVCLS